MPKIFKTYNLFPVRFAPNDSIRQTVLFADWEGKILYCNSYAEEFLGLPSSKIIGKRIDKILPGIAFKKRHETIKKLLKQDQGWSGEFTIKTNEGKETKVLVSDSPVKNEKGKIIGFIKVIRDITRQFKEQESTEFLSEASRELSKSLNYKETLNKLSSIVVPNIADWFTVDIVDELGNIELLTISHTNPRKIPLGRRIREKYVLGNETYRGLNYVVRTGNSVLYPSITEEELSLNAPNEEYIKIMKKLGFKSAMIVPLTSRGKVLGAITFVTTEESNRSYDENDLSFAESFARRAALALDNAMLYQMAQKEIIERKQTEESLRRLSETLELSQEAGNIGSFELELDTKKMMWTSKLEELYGIDSGYFGGTLKEWFSYIHPEDKENVEKIFSAAIKHHDLVNTQFRIKHSNGNIRWLSVRASVFYDETRNMERMVGIQMDITARKLLEMELRHSRDELDVILQNVADGVTVQDTFGNVIFANTKAAKLNGFKSTEEMLQKLASKSRIDYIKNFHMTSLEGETVTLEMLPGRRALKGEKDPELIVHVLDNKTGLTRWTHIKARPIFDENKKVQFAVNIMTDVTDQIESEKRKDEFIGMASHELKTPLTSMKAFVQVLQRRLEKSSDIETRNFLGRVDEQINKLNKLISDLLDISKIQAGKIEFRKEKFLLDNLITDVVESIQRTIKSHKIIVEGKSNSTVFGDQDRIGQVIINLLTNAVKYSPDAGKIIVKTFAEKSKVIIEVQDFGHGIPKEHHENIFKRFYQVNGTKNTSGGLGIGLYISSQIIKNHGGTIKVESEEGKGSIFTISLPLAKTTSKSK